MGKILEKVLEFERKYHGGIAWRIKKHVNVIEEYINLDEKILFAFCGQKNEKFFEIFNTYAVALTNKRLLLARKRLLWGSFFYSVTPDLYNDMQIYRGLMFGKIIIDTAKEKIVLSNLPLSGLDAIETAISEFMMEAKKKYYDKKDNI